MTIIEVFFSYSLKLQKLLIFSNSARLLSVRFVTQNFTMKSLVESNNDAPLNFLERFKINNLLLNTATNWNPTRLKEIQVSDDSTKDLFNTQVWSISDRCWHCLVKFAIEPAHKAIFSPRNFSFDTYLSIYNVQKVIFLNLSKDSFGLQKRILFFSLPNIVLSYNRVFLLKKLSAPRSIKLGIFRFMKLGMSLDFNYKLNKINFFSYFLSNVLINDIDFVVNSVRVGSDFLVFLKPIDDENKIIKKFLTMFSSFGIDGV
jgi:hypothetical protein